MNYLQKQLSSKTGSVSIVVFAVLVGVYVVTTQLFGDNTRVVDLIRTVLAIAWIVQVLLFIGLSVHDVGKEKGTKNYAHLGRFFCTCYCRVLSLPRCS